MKSTRACIDCIEEHGLRDLVSSIAGKDNCDYCEKLTDCYYLHFSLVTAESQPSTGSGLKE